MKDLLTLGLELIHMAVQQYGLTKTLIGIFIFILIFSILKLVGIFISILPELIIAWKS